MSRHFYQVLTVVLVAATILFSGILLLHSGNNLDELTYVPQIIPITPDMRLLQQYVRIDTSNPPGNEIAGALFLAEQLKAAGLSPEIIEPAPGRASIYARIRGKQAGEGLMLLQHIDVVPASSGEWQAPPFEGRIERSVMTGRGTLDMKGIGICHLIAFTKMATSGTVPEYDLVFLATADEESGGQWGMEWLIANRPDLFDGVKYAITEGGITETIAEKITYFGIETGSKQTVTLTIRAGTRRALEQVRIALEPYFQPRDAQVVLDEVRQYFTAVAPYRKEPGTLLVDIDKTIRDGEFWRLDTTYRELTQNNVFAKQIKEDQGGYSLDVVLANLPTVDPKDRIDWITNEVAPWGASVEVQRITGPTRISSPDTPMFALIRKAITQEYGQVPIGPMILPRVTTDCRLLRARGVGCYGMWPYPVDLYSTKGIHGVNERLRLDWYIRGVRLTTELTREYLSGN